MKAFVDKEKCGGCETCEYTCPEVFRMEGDKAFVYVDIVPVEAEESCREASEECPVGAISIE